MAHVLEGLVVGPKIASMSRAAGKADKRQQTYLHKSFGVIASPLLEVSALRKATEAWKRGNSCNSAVHILISRAEVLMVLDICIPPVNIVKNIFCTSFSVL
jgi:hypothetical protein